MIGKTISHYKILEKLGGGGMGVVYKAEDTKLKRPVALKFLPPDLIRDEEAKERFVHEAQAASALDHPNICTIHEIDETADGQIFICMAYYVGETLKKKIERGPLPIDQTFDIAIQIAQGLAKAHEHGIVHRDIKPANVMITKDGAVKIVDFGLAKLAGMTRLTKAGMTLGTVAYMSPEQARGEEGDYRTDIWSLGVVIYEMVIGQLPFKGEYEQAVVYSILNEALKPMTGLRTGVPMDLERIANKATAKSPDERYQHIDEMLVDLRAVKKDLATGIFITRAAEKTIIPSKKVKFASLSKWMGGVLLSIFSLFSVVEYFTKPETKQADDTMAVFPFENIRKDNEFDWLSNQFAEFLTYKLSEMKTLKVVDRLQIRTILENTQPLQAGMVYDIQAARKMNTSLVLMGSYTRYGDSIQVTTRLVEVESGIVRPLVQEQYSLSNLKAMQLELANKIIALVIKDKTFIPQP